MAVNVVLGSLFLSTPSARRATLPAAGLHPKRFNISIHALREEGDVANLTGMNVRQAISIHALREEGDTGIFHRAKVQPISIHALREEGDSVFGRFRALQSNFYPRPPRGGRLKGSSMIS